MGDRSLRIVVEKGPAAGAEALLDSRGLTIGCHPSADLVLPHDEFVSPEHLRIAWSERGPILRNQTPNGTLVNGRSAHEAPLAHGDTISVGLLHLLGVRAASHSAVGRDPIAAAPASGSGKTPGVRLPAWLVAYLVVMALAFTFFGVLR